MKLEVFKNAGFEIRGGLIDGEPYFVLADVCKALDIANVSQLKTRLKEDGVITNEVIDSLGRTQQATFINESNLYKTIFQSRKEEALQFQDWVTSEVLPTIRKHGAYATPETIEQMIANPDFAISLLNKLKAEQAEKELAKAERDEAIEQKLWIGNKREATAMATASAEKRRANTLQIELDKSKEWASVKKMEHHFKRSFRWQELKKVSIAMNYEIKKIEDQNYPAGVNLYHMDVWLETYGVWIDENVA